VVKWFQALRDYETRRNAGDPGIVLARRLSNVEYDYSIRDLTGVDLKPMDYFQAAWSFKNRAALGQPKAALVDFAADRARCRKKYRTDARRQIQGRDARER
jgi:hypothetical protein